ncbi:hypothetical protein Bca52824_071449 [Brassica carinata]|uniref:Uncharacterized protein n=1 Tax=Brassica carinata TaxID=52824 RepID=A0A8X7Q928_BRACI|nr:hypothetical protein Bca52824_071449 [Brassica carinata]
MTENNEEDELQSLKRVIAEQNRVQQGSEIKFHQMKQLLNQELEKSQLLERQLTENYKKSPKINWGLGYQGSTSQDYDEAGGIKFIKAEVKSDDKPKAEEKSGSVTNTKENQNTTCGHGGLFYRKRGHHGTSSHMVDKNEEIKFVKRSVPAVSALLPSEGMAVTFVVRLDIVLLSVILGETRLSELGGWIFVMWNLEGMDIYG